MRTQFKKMYLVQQLQRGKKKCKSALKHARKREHVHMYSVTTITSMTTHKGIKVEINGAKRVPQAETDWAATVAHFAVQILLDHVRAPSDILFS